MPADNYYDDGPAAATDQTSDQKESAQSENTALLPKSFFPSDKPMEPGNRCEVEIVRVHDEEVEVAYRQSDDSEAGEETESESPELAGPAPTASEMAGMME